jgi:nucleoside-diphosphate-sugar epimerase
VRCGCRRAWARGSCRRRPVRSPSERDPLAYADRPLNPTPVDAFTGRRCLVTGGLGFIGSNLALALVGAGADVTVVDARFARHGANPYNLVPAGDDAADGAPDGRVTVVEADLGDVTNEELRSAALGADLVFNLAGQVSHVDSMEDPLFDLASNTTSQFAFLDLLRRENRAARVVYTSTRQIFGKPRYLPVDEEHPVAPVDVNGITKYATEQLHLLYHDVYGMATTAVRLTNVYGPRQRLTGDLQGFLPIFVRRALDDEVIRVFGDGEQQRDCLYVDDVVDCLMLAATAPDGVGQIFNVGNDEHLSLRTIAEEVVRAAGSGRVEFAPWPPDRDAIDIGSYFGDSSKAKRMLGWGPVVEFREGIAATIDFYRSRGAWYR